MRVELRAFLAEVGTLERADGDLARFEERLRFVASICQYHRLVPINLACSSIRDWYRHIQHVPVPQVGTQQLSICQYHSFV